MCLYWSFQVQSNITGFILAFLGSEDADPHHSYSSNISTYLINTNICNQSPSPMPSNSDTMYKYHPHQAFREKETATHPGILA